MPFTKRGRYYYSPSGKRYTKRQVRAYYATNGFADKSEETPRVSTEHHPLGTQGLWDTPSEKVPEKQELPAYIQNIARALMRDHGMEESRAIATAVNAVRRWSQGNLGERHGHVHPEVQQASQRTLQEWEDLKRTHHQS